MRRTPPAVLSAVLLLAAASSANAAGGGASAPEAPLPTMRAPGGAQVEVEPQRRSTSRPTRRKAKRKPTSRGSRAPRSTAPMLSSFAVSRRMFAYGRAATVSFRIDGRTPLRNVKLRLVPTAGGTATTVDLGPRERGRLQRVRLTDQTLAQGSYRVRIGARDTHGRRLRRQAGISSAADLGVWDHRFPLVGAYTYGGAGSRFGSRREGHRHQGQDLAAALGTPVVAPRGGIIETVRYQAGGAGYYVVLDGDGEDRDYVFMHLGAGSTIVEQGQHVRTGQRLADVGNTGGSWGPHLHFEVWTGGGWYTGGTPVDPLPLLQVWDSFS